MQLTELKTIRPILERNGFRFSKSMGQNFLIAPWVPQKIAETCAAGPDDGVLEIGPGVGVLTQELSRSAAAVAAVELDKRLLPVLEETLAGCSNVTVIPGDIMKLELPALCDRQFPDLHRHVCANLPYNITTPVITKLLESGMFETLTLMVQKEVAQRICAKPGTSEYGAFTLLIRYYAEPAVCFDVPPGCFYPAPKVTSSVIRLTAAEPPAGLLDKDLLFSLTRAAFAQRRKTLLNALSPLLSGRFDKAALTALLEDTGISPSARGETLSLEQYATLANRISERSGN